MKKIRWGIIGAGRIANSFAKAFKDVKNGELIAVASKNQIKLKKICKKYKINKKYNYNSYKKLISCKDVDAVYIALVNNLHKKWIIEAAKNKKHVLAEKPAFLSYKESLSSFNKIKKHNVFFMEALMYACHPQIRYLIKILKQKKIGKIFSISCSFGIKRKNNNKNSRLYQKKLGGGSILDLGIYCVSMSRLILSIVSNKKYIDLKVSKKKITVGKSGVDESAYANLKFSNNILVSISSSIRSEMKNSVEINGSKGKIILKRPWKPFPKSKLRIKFKSGKNLIKSFLNIKNLYSYEINLVNNCILKKMKESKSIGLTWKDTVYNLKVLDQWKKL